MYEGAENKNTQVQIPYNRTYSTRGNVLSTTSENVTGGNSTALKKYLGRNIINTKIYMFTKTH